MPRTSNGPLYVEVTNRIIAKLEAGVIPWERPWASGAPRNAESARRYRGINRILLELTALERGYESTGWLTYAAARKLGGHVRRGESGTMVMYYERRPKRPTDSPSWDLETEGEYSFFARHHFVFCLDQIEGLDEIRTRQMPLLLPGNSNRRAEEILSRCGANIVFAGDAAVYAPEEDTIYLPPKALFQSETDLWATTFHELAHWTGHPTRLHRNFEGRFGDPQYAAEELIAELASAFLCTDVGLETVSNAASYINSWRQLLGADCRAIFTAAREAQLAADYLLGEWEPEVQSASTIGIDEAKTNPAFVTLG